MARNETQGVPISTGKSESWIEKTPGVCGGEACIRKTRHTVAGLVEWQRRGVSDEGILRHHPDLSKQDLDTAWLYYAQHRDEIDKVFGEE